MLKQIMKRAHELARKFEGDYQARLALALRIAWKEQKEGKEMEKIRCTKNLSFEELRAGGEVKDEFKENFGGSSIDTNKVYQTLIDEDYRKKLVGNYTDHGFSDSEFAKKNGLVFFDLDDYANIHFKGDTYNKKEQIKQFAENNNVKAEWDSNKKVWEIETEKLSDEDFAKILKATLNNWDCSRKLRKEIEEDILV